MNISGNTKPGRSDHKAVDVSYGADTSSCPIACISDLIRKRAYQIFEERGGKPGRDLSDWLRAESEIKKRLNL